MSESRKFVSTYQSLLPLIEAEEAHENVDWVKGEPTEGYVYSAPPLEIDADIETVWEVVKDIEHYGDYSDGAYVAHVEGELAVGKTIGLDVRGKGCVKQLPHSDEIINAIDDEHKIIGWKRDIKTLSEPTKRYQLLEPVAEGKTKSYIAVRIPGWIGFLSKMPIIKDTIVSGFTELNQGIKQEAEQRQLAKRG